MSAGPAPAAHRARRAIGAALVAALFAEGLARLVAGDPPGPQVRAALTRQHEIPHGRSVAHPEFGVTMAPSQQVRVDTPDFRYTLRTDHAGFANREPWPAQVDVVVLGNSLTTGAGVGLEGQFTTLLAQDLGGASVLNLGIPGGGTEHQYRAYRRVGAPLRPKVVVAALWLVYEIDNTLAFRKWLDDPDRPDFSTYYETLSRPDAAPRWRDAVRGVVENVRLLGLARAWSRSVRGLSDPLTHVVLDDRTELLLSEDEQGRLAQGWDRPGVAGVQAAFFQPLERLRDEVEARGARLLVVLVPSKEELYAGEHLPQILEPVVQARRELQARGFATLDLYPTFAASARHAPAFFRADPHPNAAGHRLLARSIAGAIRADIAHRPTPARTAGE